LNIKKNKAVFLDRDGVINKPKVINGLPYPPSSLLELELYEDVSVSVMKLKNYGYKVFIVTNQPDIARGNVTLSDVNLIHDYLSNILDIDDIYMCTHDSSQNCMCRKPKPGLLLKAAKDHNINLNESYMIGDRWRDVGAAQKAECTPIFIDRGYSETQPDGEFIKATSVESAINFILEETL